jgi:hypothetical protein
MRTLMLLLIFSCGTGLVAQQVVATAGSSLSNASGSISYTIGEGIAQTLSKGDKTLTQGFHQTTISVSIVSVIKDLGFSVSVFPNPASDELTLKLDTEKVTGLQYLLFDPNGKLISQKNLISSETKIHVDQLATGLYILKLQSGSKELKTFKFIKQ